MDNKVTITLNIEDININLKDNEYFIIKDNYDFYYIGGILNREIELNRRFNIKDNLEKLICNNCYKRESTTKLIKNFYDLINNETLNLIENTFKDLFYNKEIIESIVINSNKILKEQSIKINKEEFYILYINENSNSNNVYLSKEKINKYEQEVEVLNIKDIFFKKDICEKKLISIDTFLKEVSFFREKYEDILYFLLLDISMGEEINRLKNLFIDIKYLKFRKLKINLGKFYNNNLNYNIKTENLIEELNNKFLSIRFNINNYIEKKQDELLKDKKYCKYIKNSSNYYQFPNCSLKEEIIEEGKLDFNKHTLIKEEIIKNIINKCININEQDILFKNLILPININNIGLFIPLYPFNQDPLNYYKNKDIYILKYLDNDFEPYLLGNVNLIGKLCLGDLISKMRPTPTKLFKNLNLYINKILKSIFTIEDPSSFTLFKEDIYIKDDLNMIDYKNIKDRFKSTLNIDPLNKNYYLFKIPFEPNKKIININITFLNDINEDKRYNIISELRINYSDNSFYNILNII